VDEAALAEAAIRRFLAAARRPALIEPGEDRFLLREDTYALEWHGNRLLIQAWDETRNLARRIVGVHEERAGRLELTIERFGGIEGRISLLDVDRAGPAGARRGPRLVFREEFRRALRRQFPEWCLVELSAELNLEESLSAAYPRALIRKGGQGWAAIASPPGATSGVLTFGLIWLDYLRKRERRISVEGLALFVPHAEARVACLRLPFLNPRAARFAAFVYTADGYEDRLDPTDYGNLATKLDSCSSFARTDRNKLPPGSSASARCRLSSASRATTARSVCACVASSSLARRDRTCCSGWSADPRRGRRTSRRSKTWPGRSPGCVRRTPPSG
jgi:hypothetical protein